MRLGAALPRPVSIESRIGFPCANQHVLLPRIKDPNKAKNEGPVVLVTNAISMLRVYMARVSPQVVIVSSISVIIQFALAILAWGDWSTFFAHPARFWVVIGSFLLLIVAWFSGTSGLSAGEQHSSGSKNILYGFFSVILALVLVPPFCDRRNVWTIDGDTVRYFGLILFFAGSILRLAAAFALGHRFSGLVAIQPDHQLKTNGLYRYIRHPSYTGLLVAMIGWVLVFRSAIGLLLNIPLFLLLLSRMNDEEKFLETHFGGHYRAYREKTRRLIPFVY